MTLSRRGFFGALAGAAAALVVPKKTFFFGMGLPQWNKIQLKWDYARVKFDGVPVEAGEIHYTHGPCRCGKVHTPIVVEQARLWREYFDEVTPIVVEQARLWREYFDEVTPIVVEHFNKGPTLLETIKLKPRSAGMSTPVATF